jgi:toxin-antitoxin system PIN domain toxin
MVRWLCDSNIWLALVLSGHVHHAAVRDWLETIGEPASVLFCRATQQAFLRLLTNMAVLAPYGNPPLTNQQAWSAYEALLADDRIVFRAQEPAGLDLRWKEFALRDTASPKLWMDAYLAAFALAGGYHMVSTDTAYRQFGGLDLVLLAANPGAGCRLS